MAVEGIVVVAIIEDGRQVGQSRSAILVFPKSLQFFFNFRFIIIRQDFTRTVVANIGRYIFPLIEGTWTQMIPLAMGVDNGILIIVYSRLVKLVAYFLGKLQGRNLFHA
jgi:hypothetical protein